MANNGNQLWWSTSQSGAPILKALFYTCTFRHQVLSPMSLVSLTQIAWKERRSCFSRTRNDKAESDEQSSSALWCLRLPLILVRTMMHYGFGTFWRDLSESPLWIVSVLGSFSLDHERGRPEPGIPQGLLAVLSWQLYLLFLTTKCSSSDDQVRSQAPLFLANVVYIGLQGSRGGVSPEAGAILTNLLAKQITIRTHILLDGKYNPTPVRLIPFQEDTHTHAHARLKKQ